MKHLNFITKSIILFLLIGSFSFSSYSRNIKTNDSGKSELQTIDKSATHLHLINHVGSIKAVGIETDNGNYTRLLVKNYSKSSTLGKPDLPIRRTLIDVPVNAEPQIRIIGYDIKEYALDDFGVNHPLFPAQPPQPKCGNNPDFCYDADQYQNDQFFGTELVSIEVLGFLRSQRLARLDISPIQYNPVKNSIQVYENIEFEITFEHADLAATEALRQRLYSPFFNGISQSIINYTEENSYRENLTQYPVKYVVVADRMFEDQLQPFLEWKTRKGFMVVEAYTDVIGSSKEEIKDYLEGLYNAGTPEDPAPSFVLFVGDIDEVPVWNNGNGVTDRNYVEYTGDLFPEIFYGRFSAENTTQLQPYIDKTLQYEQYTMPVTSYLDTVVLVAGMDGSHGNDWGNGHINYGTINYFNEEHDIFSHTYLYPESGNHSADIQQNISDGVTFSNYTAHCGPGGWSDPSFSIGDIAGLNNQDKYGLMIGNCCSSSEYQQDCFAEEILRAENKGAVGYIGGSNSTYWDEDYYFGVGVGSISENPPPYEETGLGNFDRSFHDHGEAFGEWYATQDQIIYAGNLAVTIGSPGSAEYYWDIYNLMGDPSLMIYYSEPPEMTVSHPSTILIGQTSITVDAVPYAIIGISINNVLHGTAIADAGGHAEITIDPFMVPGDADFVVTAQNYQPYIGSISVVPADGAFVIYADNMINDANGNNNGQIDYHETVLMDLTMGNVGNQDALAVEVVLSTDNPFITLIDSVESYGTVPANGQVNIEDAFEFTAADEMTDLTSIVFTLTATETAKEEFISSFQETGHAPDIQLTNFVVDDSQGNGNGKLDPGETANLGIYLKNNGSSDAMNVLGTLLSQSEFLTVNTGEQTYGLLQADSAQMQVFSVSTSGDTPNGSSALIDLSWIADYGIEGMDNISLVVGQIPVLILNFTESDVSSAAMQQCFDVLTVGSQSTSSLPAETEIYQSIFVCLGIYPNNHQLSDGEGQKLADFLDNGGRVYMEGGDTWAYDSQSPVHPYFSIDGTSDGDGDLSVATGVEGTFAEGFVFNYSGENSYIDHLAPEGSAFTLFENTSAAYDLTIANETETYKTVGSSFTFGGLDDSETSTKDGIMAEILSFFDIYFVWTGEEENSAITSELKVFPNPTSGQLNIQLQLNQKQTASIVVYDLAGREVLSLNNQNQLNKGINRMQLDVSKLKAGIYTLIANTSEGRMARKFVVAE